MKKRKIVYNIVIIAILLVGLAVVLSKFLHLGNVEYTDNAAVCQHITPTFGGNGRGFLTCSGEKLTQIV